MRPPPRARRERATRRPPLAAALMALMALMALVWTLTPTRVSAQLAPGSFAVVAADGDCLRLRAGPGLDAPVITCLTEGSVVTVLDGSQAANGLTWQLVRAGKDTGWVADRYLKPLNASPSAPAPAPPAAPVSSPTISGELPAGGGPALVVWGGGGSDQVLSAAAARGCALISMWATRAGSSFVGYIAGAPPQVNAAWSVQFPGGLLPPQTPLFLLCAAATVATPPAPAAPAVQQRTAALPPGTPAGPPGPAGNE